LKCRALSDKQEGIVDSIHAELQGIAQQDEEEIRQALADQERFTEVQRKQQAKEERLAQEEAEYAAQRAELSERLHETGRGPEGWVLVHGRDYAGGKRWVTSEHVAQISAREEMTRATFEAEQMMADSLEADESSDDNGQEARHEGAILQEEKNTDG